MARDVVYTFTATDRAGHTATQQLVVSVSEPGLNLPRIPWEGGSAYWQQFPKAHAAGWSVSTFFPIAVFLSKPDDPRHVDVLKSLGINTYQGVEHNLPLTAATSRGMFVLPHYLEWTAAEIGNNPMAVGHFVSDECEMGYSGCGDSEPGQLAKQQEYCAALRARNDGRFLQANFGNGILRSFWSPNTMSQHVRLMDAGSADKYAYTSPDVRFELQRSPDWPASQPNAKCSGAYGWMVDQMRRFQDPAKLRAVWCFVETARPYLGESGAETITPDQIEGAVWASLRHEARGICYFQHNNDPAIANYSLVDGPTTLKNRVKAINDKVRALAPVLNTQTYVWNFGATAETMLKQHSGFVYVFAGIGLGQAPGSKTLTLPPGVTGASVEVLFENRSVPITNGRWTDSFAAEFTNHVYKVAL